MGNVVLPMWAQCPAFTRLVCVGYPVLSMVLMILQSAGLSKLVTTLFVCNVQSIKMLWVWTLFLGPFFSPIGSGMAFLFVLFEIWMVMMYFPIQENALGSSSFLFWILLMNGLVNMGFLLIMYAFSLWYANTFYWGMYVTATSKGLWPLVMVLLTVRCLSDPQGSTSFWGLVQIPNKWYPLCLTAFFCLLSGMKILWDFVAALAIGYSYQYLPFERLLPSRVRVSQLEARCCHGGQCSLLGASWIPASSTPGFELESGGRRFITLGDMPSGAQMPVRGGDGQSTSSGGGGGGHFTAFSGGGNRLGDGSDVPHPVAPYSPGPAGPGASSPGPGEAAA
mmetsp:Transcript_81793/g.254268  ORF Transcript_81793/g.254268 Transcript_81793/m.254268 type:complete len:336 (+) Transcript_81793:58-1065(+)